LATATASNIGSVATVTGNPQNIVIGSLSHISYGDFALELMPIAFVGLMACADTSIGLDWIRGSLKGLFMQVRLLLRFQDAHHAA
jgi:Na+/H+ antiporter NhaB